MKNNADGSISFGEVTYSEAGTHYYQISEIEGRRTDISYDKTIFTVRVDVKANGNGLMITKTLYNADETAAEVTFTNRGVTSSTGSDEDQAYRGPSADVEQPYIGEDEEFEFEDSEESEEEYDDEEEPKKRAKRAKKAKAAKKVSTVKTVKSVKTVKTVKSVKTGDTANTTVWMLSLLAAACAFASETVRRRKNR